MTRMTLEQALTQGVQLHQAGRLADAEGIYRQILSSFPNQPDALHFLGLIAFDKHCTAEALDLLRRAIAINPNSSGYQCNLGRILDESGQIDDAIAAFREALRLQPQNPDAWNNLGTALLKQDQFKESIDAFQQAIRLRPQFPEARNNLGQVLLTKGRLEEAAVLFREAIALNPNYAAAHTNLGIALRRQDKITEAVEQFRIALALEPNSPLGQVNYGKILYADGQLDQAIAIFRNVIAAHSQNATAHCNLGEALLAKNELGPAIASLNLAIALQPRTADLLNNLGHAFHAAGEFEQAISCYRKALDVRPSWPLAKYNLGIDFLLQGDYAQGWALYESRFDAPDLGRNYLEFPQPRWDGGELNGRRILLHVEQGLGDAIQFIRYLPQVVERLGKVVLHVPSELAKLFRNMPNVEQVTSFDEKPPVADAHCPLLSLPGVFGTTPNSIPAEIPYLKADEQQSRRWRDRLVGESRLKVGIVWAGRPTYQNDRIRSITLETLSPLCKVADVAFYSLQKGSAADQLRHAAAEFGMIDWTNELHDFADTAALIDNLDLVISVDTAVAHLAGAMGKRVWLLLPFVPDWRWMLDRSDSPWYPTMRLFRQTRFGNWHGVIQNVVQALQEFKINPA